MVFIRGRARPQRLIAEQRLDVLERAADDGASAAFDDGALHQFRVRDHERDGLFVRQFAPVWIQLVIDGFFRAQQFARRDAQLGDEFAQFLFAERRGRVIDLLEFDAALTEQAACLAAGASSRLFVDRDLVVVHFVLRAKREARATRTVM